MSPEGASGGAIGAAASAVAIGGSEVSAGAVGISTPKIGSFSPPTESFGSYNPSTLPAPELPSFNGPFIEVSSPSSTVGGDFNVHEIVARSFIETSPRANIGQTRIDPVASVLNPKIVEQINTLPVWEKESEPKVKSELESVAFDQVAKEDELVEKLEVEVIANTVALQKAVDRLKTYEMDEEEMKKWEQKLKAAAQVGTLTQPQQGEVEPLIQAINATPTAATSAATAVEEVEEIEEEKEILVDTQEYYDFYELDHKWENAKEVNERREEIVMEVTNEGYKYPKYARLATEAVMAKVDTPTLEEAHAIADGDLIEAPITHKVYNALTYMKDTQDPDEVREKALETLWENPAIARKRYIKKVERVEVNEMPEETQPFIQKGVKNLVYINKKGWKAVPHLPLKNPYEAKKAA